jgi:hypothetical protein
LHAARGERAAWHRYFQKLTLGEVPEAKWRDLFRTMRRKDARTNPPAKSLFHFFRDDAEEPHDSILERFLVWYQCAWKTSWTETLKALNQQVEMAKLPVEDQTGNTQGAQPAFLDLGLAGAFDKVVRSFKRSKAHLRAAAAAVAAERFRLDKGRWPRALTELTPNWIGKVPLDPFTGQALLYRALPDGVVIYSVGEDLKDHGGRFRDTNDDYQPDKLDVGFRLWDPAHRRQPPRPPMLLKKRENLEDAEAP